MLTPEQTSDQMLNALSQIRRDILVGLRDAANELLASPSPTLPENVIEFKKLEKGESQSGDQSEGQAASQSVDQNDQQNQEQQNQVSPQSSGQEEQQQTAPQPQNRRGRGQADPSTPSQTPAEGGSRGR